MLGPWCPTSTATGTIELHRRVQAPAVEPPISVPEQLTALRVSCVLADALPDREAVHQGVVPGHVADENWMVGRRPVEVGPGGRPVRELGVVEAEGLIERLAL